MGDKRGAPQDWRVPRTRHRGPGRARGSLAEDRGAESGETEVARGPGTEDRRGESCRTAPDIRPVRAWEETSRGQREPSRKMREDTYFSHWE